MLDTIPQERKGDHKNQATSWSRRCGREATDVCAGNSDINSPPGRMVAGALLCVRKPETSSPLVLSDMAGLSRRARLKLTPEHLMDCAQAATAALLVSQSGVGIRAMPM